MPSSYYLILHTQVLPSAYRINTSMIGLFPQSISNITRGEVLTATRKNFYKKNYGREIFGRDDAIENQVALFRLPVLSGGNMKY